MNPVPKPPEHASECVRADLAGDLIRWDELDFRRRVELETHATTCPTCGPALSLLRRADAWLNGQGRRVQPTHFAAGACPDAEVLYDYGQGPGATPLSDERRKAVDAHLLGCAECRELVTTLASRPPSPILLDAPEEPELDRPAEPRHDRREPLAAPVLLPKPHSAPARRWLWIPAAAAALVLVALGLWWRSVSAHGGDTLVAQGIFPAEEVLRGDDGTALYYPRGAVLALDGRPWQATTFEVSPRADAQGYRWVLFARDGAALGASRELARWETAEPNTTFAGAELGLGRYTWEAWALVGGLEVHLGRADFHVRADAAADGLLAALELSGDDRARAVLAWLHDRGYLGDARAFARTLPPSPERDAYRARKPGR
ncbi:MAG: hypothetical protein IT453_12660 [Planctomycetes bacterium]|nr:hypothetical protein [Planctomycetota bacterium]